MGYAHASMELDEKVGCWERLCGRKNARVGRLEYIGVLDPADTLLMQIKEETLRKVQAIDQQVLEDADLFATAYKILVFAKKASKQHKKAKKRCHTFIGKPEATFCSNGKLGLREWNRIYGQAAELELITPWGGFGLISDTQQTPELREKIKQAVLRMKDVTVTETYRQKGGFGIHQRYFHINGPHAGHKCICLRPWFNEPILPAVATFIQKQQEAWQKLMSDYHAEHAK